MIKLLRIDERLIHGQVAYAWTTSYKSQALMVVTMEKKNDLERMSLELACPRNLKCFISTVDEAVEILTKHASKQFFVVTDDPQVVLELMKSGVEIPSVNVGGLYHKEDRESISKTVFLDTKLKEVFRAIAEQGVELDVRATPTDKSVDLKKFI